MCIPALEVVEQQRKAVVGYTRHLEIGVTSDPPDKLQKDAYEFSLLSCFLLFIGYWLAAP